MKLVLTIRTSLFYIGYTLSIFIFSMLSCTVGMCLSVPKRQTLATTGNYLLLKWLNFTCGINVVVEGAENIPTTPFVVLCNHQSPWETFYLQRTRRPVSTILKKELLKIPVFGWGLASVKPIAINRDNPRQALKDVMEQGKARLAAGMNVIVFPEGTRFAYGEYGSYARSGAALAVAAGVPILPLAHNAGRHWPARRFLKYPGTITLVIGKPIEPTSGDSKSITREAESWIKAQQKRLY